MAVPFRASPTGTPMFSVVIPLFNKRPWIRRALNSVAAQEFPAAEVIVVNDGSTDGGDEAARAWGDPRLRVIDQANRGVSAARNVGIATATQPFVAFLDADDEWMPPFLDRMRVLIEAHPGAVLYGSGFLSVAEGRVERRHGMSAGHLGGPVDLFRELSRGHVVHQSGTVVPRAAALAVGGYPEGLRDPLEDQIFWLTLALTGPVVLTPEPLVRYDMAVPGQALGEWRKRHAYHLDVSDLDRFVAAELTRRQGRDEATPGERSFIAYARGRLASAVLQRAYWGRFDEVARFGRELGLDGLHLGWPAAVAGWVTRHPILHPCARGATGIIRGARQAILLGFRRPPA
jgi:glycosyltransferase involved in cell wall biosynthesis